MTRIALVVAAICLIGAPAIAQTKTCKIEASEHKPSPLAGAALTSFMQKCEKDASADCEKQAAAHKPNPLAGAAKTSFVTKCVKDKVGS